MLIFDDILKRRPVPRSKMQLFAAVSVWIAWKFDDDGVASTSTFSTW